MNERSLLRAALDECGVPLKDVTVLATQNDPFRQDTEANHRDGSWLAMQVDELGLTDRDIHLRGLHYALLGTTRPNGLPYINDEACWTWLQNTAAKAARWLGYLPWERIKDQRNAEPIVRLRNIKPCHGYVSLGGLNIEVPDAEDIEPQIEVANFHGTQPFKIVFFGEKSSLQPVLEPLAVAYDADLYLPTGEISDTLLHQMARIGADDGRPMVVLTFSDCDPSGWQMPISIGRKLQAFKTTLFPELEFEVRRVGLLPDHVREHGLPSTPLKDTERRGDKWTEATGVHQTEIDALASLRPDLLTAIAKNAIWNYYDRTLASRVRQARSEWLEAAQEVLDDAIDPDLREQYRTEAEHRLDALREQVEQLEQELQLDPGDVDLPPIAIPQAITPLRPEDPPLVDSRWPFVEQCQALIESKGYRR